MWKIPSLRKYLNINRHCTKSSSQRFSTFSARNAQYRSFNGKSNKNTTINITNLLYSRNTLYFGLGVGGFCLYNMDSAPYTGRLRVLWVPYYLEKKVGDYSYQQIMNQYGANLLPRSHSSYRKVSKVMNKLLSTAISNTEDESQRKHLESLDWSIQIIQVDQGFPPNAFILPNGKIFVFSSILPICQDENGLATVLSHELSHQLARHSSEQLSKQPFYVALSLLMYATTGADALSQLFINGVLKMPSSRQMETEADRIGCTLMAKSCFDIHQAERFWERMYKWEQTVASGGTTLEFFSTHPGTQKRIANIKEWIPELEQIRENSGCYDYQFGDFIHQSRDFFKFR